MLRNIIAIGGGNVGGGETLSIDRRFVCQVDADRPKLLFIPTATMDSEEYVAAIEATYRDRLACDVDVLRLYSDDNSLPKIKSKLERADLIYVGGGNTKAMLEKWQSVGLDREIRKFVAAGRPVAGLSAGAICWFRVGNSDWPQYENIPDVLTARLDGLGIIDLVACPHTKGESFRLRDFEKMMLEEIGVGIGLDDCCAIQVRGDEYRILASAPGCVAHLIFTQKGEIVHEIIEPHNDYRSIRELQSRADG